MSAAISLGGSPARADLYGFSYQLTTGKTVSGTLDGTLQSDGNTFDMTGVDSLLIDGVAVTEALTVLGTDAFYGENTNKPSATLNTSLLDFTIENSTKSDLLIFGVRDETSDDRVGYDFVGASASFGGDGKLHVFAQARYTDQLGAAPSVSLPSTAIPEPASLSLMGAATFAASLLRRRRLACRVRPSAPRGHP